MFLLRIKNSKMKSITMSGANSQALIVCLICRSVLDDLEDNLVDNDLKLEDCQEQLSLGASFYPSLQLFQSLFASMFSLVSIAV